MNMRNLTYEVFEKIKVSRPVNRYKFICEAVKGKVVLDLGCLDETAYSLKGSTDTWLHKLICDHAKYVYGVDNSNIIPEEGIRPFKNSIIYKHDVYDLHAIIEKIDEIDIIIAGELIEHLPDVQLFLKNIKSIGKLKDKPFIVTTPNGCSTHNVIIGMFNMENNHPDHVNLFSYKILYTLSTRTGFCEWDLIPCYSIFNEMKLKSTGFKKIAVTVFQSVVNLIEYVFPMLSAGWIVKIRI
ncbi:MAG: hypothetical protein NW207_01260 [Cytophagales bacterium]|nr:hypothetical protein [Cytophagales bacterium]